MKIAVMQPYFFPYIGYFQLIAAADRFVVYDNIKYTKKGWINRNRILSNGREVKFSLPIKGGSDSLHIVDRELASDFSRQKLLNQFHEAYRSAPCFAQLFPLVESMVNFEAANLFDFLMQSIAEICRHLGIDTDLVISSAIPIDHDLRSQDRVLAICSAMQATTYINPIGGLDLYSADSFSARGIDLRFLRSRWIEYSQHSDNFVPWLSIIDVLMFNNKDEVKDMLFLADLVNGDGDVT